MRVNVVNQSTPSFGRMMIEVEAEDKLQKLQNLTIDQINSAGEIVEDTKNYHILITKDLEAKLVSKNNPYFGLFKNEKYSTHYGTEKFNGKSYENKHSIVIKDATRTRFKIEKGVTNEEAETEYDVHGPFGRYDSVSDIIPLAMATKLLDDVSIQKTNEALKKANTVLKKDAAIKSTKHNSSDKVRHLLDKYGV